MEFEHGRKTQGKNKICNNWTNLTQVWLDTLMTLDETKSMHKILMYTNTFAKSYKRCSFETIKVKQNFIEQSSMISSDLKHNPACSKFQRFQGYLSFE